MPSLLDLQNEVGLAHGRIRRHVGIGQAALAGVAEDVGTVYAAMGGATELIGDGGEASWIAAHGPVEQSR